MTQSALFGGAPAPEPKEEPVTLTTREISRFVTFFKTEVRLHTVQETSGVFNNIKRLLAGNEKKGQRPLLPQEIADALKNYANDPFVQSCDQRTRKHIRSFFTYETIIAWLKPVQPRQPRQAAAPREAALDNLEVLGQRRRAAPLKPPPTIVTQEEDSATTF